MQTAQKNQVHYLMQKAGMLTPKVVQKAKMNGSI